MACGCSKRLGGGVRGVGHNPISTPRRGTLVVPRAISPTERRELNQPNPRQFFSAQRREIERKRRLAIQHASGR